MDALIRIFLFISIASGLLGANFWFINIFRKAFFSKDAVITSFKIVGKEDDKGKLGGELAVRLESQLKKIQQQLENSHLSLKKSVIVEKTLNSSALIVSPQILPKADRPSQSLETLNIPIQVLQPLNINVTIGGVDWGQFLPRFQRWMVKERTINFTVFYESDQVKVFGNIGPFGQSKRELLFLEDIEPNNDDEIVNHIAYQLIKKKLSEDPSNKIALLESSKIELLELQEFRDLLNIINNTARLNRNIKRGLYQKDEFAKLFIKIKQFVTQTEEIKDWYSLIYFTASIAESAEEYDQALSYYKQLEEAKNKGEENLEWLKSEFLTSKLENLSNKIEPKVPEIQKVPLKKLREDADYAVNFLNKLFDLNLEVPPINLLDQSFRNAYWDGEKYNAPPQVQNIPHITYHIIAHPFIGQKVNFIYQGQSVALYESYADIFASLIKQSRSKQTAQTADWTIGSGGIAWLKGEDILSSKDKSPLRSLKAPGTAYQDPLVGTDSQVAHFQKLYTGFADNGGVHINSGIPNKAFYETAIVIGSNQAGQIWYEALSKLSPTSNFQEAAKATYQIAGELYGNNSKEQKAVQAAWEVVGISPKSFVP